MQCVFHKGEQTRVARPTQVRCSLAIDSSSSAGSRRLAVNERPACPTNAMRIKPLTSVREKARSWRFSLPAKSHRLGDRGGALVASPMDAFSSSGSPSSLLSCAAQPTRSFKSA